MKKISEQQYLNLFLQAGEKLKAAGASDRVIEALQYGVITVSDHDVVCPLSLAPEEWQTKVESVIEQHDLYAFHIIHDCRYGDNLCLLCFPLSEYCLEIAPQLSSSGEDANDFYAYVINLSDPEMSEPGVITVVSEEGVLSRHMGGIEQGGDSQH